MQHAAQSVTVTITTTDALTCWHQAIAVQGDIFQLEELAWCDHDDKPKRITWYQAGRHFVAYSRSFQYDVYELLANGKFGLNASALQQTVAKTVKNLVNAANAGHR